jgi:type I restriction enzyme, S subunit
MSNRVSWHSTRLGDIVAIKHGWPFQSDLFSEDLTGRPIIVSIGNFEYTGGFRFESTRTKEYCGEYPPEYELSSGDILLVMTCQTAGGEILGIPGRIPDDGRTYLHNQRMGKVDLLRPDLVDLDYLYWLFLWKPFNQSLFNSASGTKILHTSPGRIAAFKFFLPPLPEQRAIARILGALDDKIELNRRQNTTLEELARAIFKSWFVDFDPVRARAEGRAPAAMDAATAALFPDSFEEIDGRKVPRGWQLARLDRVAENPRRNLHPGEVEPETPYIGLEHMPRKRIALDEWGSANAVESNKFRFERGEILFGKLRPYFHKVGVAPVSGVCSTDILVLRSVDESWFGFVLSHVSSDQFVQHTNQTSDGTKMPRTSWKDMSRYQVVLPPKPVAAQYNNLVFPFVRKIAANIQQSRTLAALRDALLPRLLSGDLRVREARRLVEEGV